MIDQYQTLQPKKQKSKIGLILGPLAIIIVLVVVYFLSRQATEKVYKNFKPIEPDTSATIAPPTAAPEVTVDPKQYSISILNGSGITGQAGQFKTLLEEKGFDIKSTANADKEDYTEVQISDKKTVSQNFTNELKKIISSSFTVSDTIEELSEDVATDIEIITAPEK